MTDWAAEYLQMIEDCEARESRLTNWERGFVDSIRAQLERNRPLTPKQTETLDTIWERATAKG
jgi:phosphoserine phosphatase